MLLVFSSGLVHTVILRSLTIAFIHCLLFRYLHTFQSTFLSAKNTYGNLQNNRVDVIRSIFSLTNVPAQAVATFPDKMKESRVLGLGIWYVDSQER